MYEKLRKFIEKYHRLKFYEWAFIKKMVKIKHFKKGEIIHHQGDVCERIYFVNSGLLRGYIIDEKGKDYTWHIFFNDEYAQISNLLVVDYESYIKKSRSLINIEVLEECELICFERKELDKFFSTKFGLKIGMIFSQEAYCILHNYVISYATEDAKKRFERFMSHSSHWFDLIPQHYIATHLGITPQSLSRLKNKKLTKN